MRRRPDPARIPRPSSPPSRSSATKKIAKGEAIQAYGYDENVMPAGQQLNRDDLDKAFPDNPVLVGHGETAEAKRICQRAGFRDSSVDAMTMMVAIADVEKALATP